MGYVAVIAVVVVAFQLLPPARRPADKATVPAATSSLPERMVEPGSPLAPEEFHAPPDLDQRDPPPMREVSEPVAAVNRAKADPQFDKAALAAVRDNTLGVRADEAEAFFTVLDHARRVPATELDQAARSGVQYVNLMSDPALYRGEPVTVTGEMWRLSEFTASQNRHGLTRLYEAWVFTSDSSTHPLRIVATGLGEDLQPGDSQRTPVRVTGYFFKREGYETKAGLQVAPTLLAGQIVRHHSPGAPPSAEGVAPMLLGLVVAIGLILSVTLLSFAGNDRRDPRRAGPLPALSDDAARRVETLDPRSVSEQLRELAERERMGPLLSASPAGDGPRKSGDEYVELPTPFPPTRVPRPER